MDNYGAIEQDDLILRILTNYIVNDFDCNSFLGNIRNYYQDYESYESEPNRSYTVYLPYPLYKPVMVKCLINYLSDCKKEYASIFKEADEEDKKVHNIIKDFTDSGFDLSIIKQYNAELKKDIFNSIEND